MGALGWGLPLKPHGLGWGWGAAHTCALWGTCSLLPLLGISWDLPAWGRYPQLLSPFQGEVGGERKAVLIKEWDTATDPQRVQLRIAMCFLKANRTPQVLMQIHSS